MSTTTEQIPFTFAPPTPPPGIEEGGVGSLDALVQATRREIAEIVREVAAEARREQPRAVFLRLLADRALRAMAAEGVIVWRRREKRDRREATGEMADGFEPLVRLGVLTDLTLPKTGRAAHGRLLEVIAEEGIPAVVPPTPGATAPDVPANPTPSPAALVPVGLHPSGPTEYLLEAFLKAAGNPASQRGYLRFVSQLGDLAGDFLRHDELRVSRHGRELACAVDDVIESFHRSLDPETIAKRLVDEAADLFSFARVGLCRVERSTQLTRSDGATPRLLRPKLVAVSHVNKIVERSGAAERLREAAVVTVPADGSVWIEADLPTEGETVSEELRHRCTVASAEGAYRLVGFDRDEEPVNEDVSRRELSRLVRHAELAIEAAVVRQTSLPILSFLPTLPFLRRRVSQSSHAKPRWRNRIVPALTVAALSGVAFVPVPRFVTAGAVIRPVDVQLVCAHRDAIVREIHVTHGQEVRTGEVLVTLEDPELDEQIAELKSRRAILVQQQARWVESIVVGGTEGHARQDQLVGQQLLAEEEVRGVDAQLAVLERIRRGLTLKADQDGRVDAWRLDERFQDRPLRRGDPLLQIVGDSTAWIAEVDVPQKRIAWIRQRMEDGFRAASVAPDADPDRRWPAVVERIGPSATDPVTRLASTSVRVRLEGSASSELARTFGAGSQQGTPAHVSFRCGSSPLVGLLFGDAYREVTGRLRMYGGSRPVTPESARDEGTEHDG